MSCLAKKRGVRHSQAERDYLVKVSQKREETQSLTGYKRSFLESSYPYPGSSSSASSRKGDRSATYKLRERNVDELSVVILPYLGDK